MRATSLNRGKLSFIPSFRSKFLASCQVHQRWCKGAYLKICSCTTLSMAWCLSDMTPISLRGPMTCIRTSHKNHPQLSLFFISTKAKAKGTNALSTSCQVEKYHQWITLDDSVGRPRRTGESTRMHGRISASRPSIHLALGCTHNARLD
jgi:hypothetical protein